MTTHDLVQKELATQKKDSKVNQAELDKQAARQHNAATSEYNSVGKVGTFLDCFSSHNCNHISLNLLIACLIQFIL